MAGGAAVGGGLLGGIGAMQSARADAAALEEDAQTQMENAVIARKAGVYDSERLQVATGRKIGEMQAGYAASGIEADSGSVLDTLAFSHTNAEMDRLNILYGSELKARGFERQAASDKSRASAAKSMGYFQAFTSAFSGGYKAYNYSASGKSAKENSSDSDLYSDEDIGMFDEEK